MFNFFEIIFMAKDGGILALSLGTVFSLIILAIFLFIRDKAGLGVFSLIFAVIFIAVFLIIYFPNKAEVFADYQKLISVDPTKVYDKYEIYEITGLEVDNGYYRIDNSKMTKELYYNTMAKRDNPYFFIVEKIEDNPNQYIEPFPQRNNNAPQTFSTSDVMAIKSPYPVIALFGVLAIVGIIFAIISFCHYESRQGIMCIACSAILIIFVLGLFYGSQSSLNAEYADFMSINTEQVYDRLEIYQMTDVLVEEGQYKIDTSLLSKELFAQAKKNGDNIYKYLIVKVDDPK